MSKTILDIISRDGNTVIASIHWKDGIATVQAAMDLIRPRILRWQESGITEISPTGRIQRTPPSSPVFLERLARYVRERTGFSVRLTQNHETHSVQQVSGPPPTFLSIASADPNVSISGLFRQTAARSKPFGRNVPVWQVQSSPPSAEIFDEFSANSSIQARPSFHVEARQ